MSFYFNLFISLPFSYIRGLLLSPSYQLNLAVIYLTLSAAATDLWTS